MSSVGIVFQFLLVNNLVLYYFLGVCPAIEFSENPRTVVKFGAVLSFVFVLSSLLSSMVNTFVLLPLGLEILRTFVLLILIGALVQALSLGAERIGGAFGRTLNRFLPMLAANCAVFGLSMIVIDLDGGLAAVLAAAIGAGFGVVLVLLLLAAIRDHVEIEWIHPALRGTPIIIISAGLMAMAFHAFDQLFLTGLF